MTNNGKTLKYSIPQELYDSLEKHQKGTLATADGEFFYFGDGEDITQ